MKSLNIYSIAIFALGLSATVAVAGSHHHGGVEGKFMSLFDANKDNMVTLAELDAVSKQRFAKMDADANGVVSLDEFQAYLDTRKSERRMQRFAQMDANNDRQVSKEEYIQYKMRSVEQQFQAADTDHDGLVSEEEYLARKWDYHGGKHGKHAGHHRGGNRFFTKLDSNGDEQLTLDETLNAWNNWFKRIDANNDQVVSQDEIEAFRNKMLESRKLY